MKSSRWRSLWGQEARNLRERLLAAGTHQDRFIVLEQHLHQQLVRPLEHHSAVNYALRYFSHSGSISDVTDKIALSPRRFIEVFSQPSRHHAESLLPYSTVPKKSCAVSKASAP